MDKQTVIEITVTPKSSKSLVSAEGENIKAWLHSPPADGLANKELIELLSKALKIPKSGISIDRGASGRKKRLTLNGISREEVFEKLWQNR